jgi:hypothetical protein
MSSFLLPEVLAERGRVSQGNPSLSSERRATITYRQKQRDKSRALAADGESKQKALTAPDGKRDTTSYEAQAGLELEPYIIMCRLRKLNHQLHFEPSIHDSQKMGIYLLDPLADEGKGFSVVWSGNARCPNSPCGKSLIKTWLPARKTGSERYAVGDRSCQSSFVAAPSRKPRLK